MSGRGPERPDHDREAALAEAALAGASSLDAGAGDAAPGAADPGPAADGADGPEVQAAGVDAPATEAADSAAPAAASDAAAAAAEGEKSWSGSSGAHLASPAAPAPSSSSSTPEKSPRTYPSRPIVGVGAVIIEAGRVVLIKRRYEPLAGQWSLPGGTLEVGETLESGVAREMLEETGLEVEVGPVIDVFDRIMFDADRKVRYHFVLIDYLCHPRGGRLAAASDVTDAIYVHPDDLAAYNLTAKAEEMIRKGFDLWRRIGGS